MSHPTIETQTERLVHGFSFANHLKDLGLSAQQSTSSKASADLAIKDASGKMRHSLMSMASISASHRWVDDD